MAQRSSAEKEFDTAVGQVLALGQTYPQLNSSSNFLNLQQNLADTEDKLAFARQYLQRRGRDRESTHHHHPVDVRRAHRRGVPARLLPSA